MQNNQEVHKEWFKKAEEDELSIKAIIKEGGSPSTACFLSQQMAEKYLKGLLVFYQKDILKVHDLLELETLLLDHAKDIAQLHPNLVSLNRYYIETRYPGDYPELTRKDADMAYEDAAKVKEFAVAHVSLS